MAKVPTIDLRPNPRKIPRRRKRAATRRVKRARAKRVRGGGGYVVEVMKGKAQRSLKISYLSRAKSSKPERFSTEASATKAAHAYMLRNKNSKDLYGTRVMPA